MSRSGHQVGVGVHHDDGVVVPTGGLLPELVGHDVVHQGGLAHARAGHVEVVAPEQVVGEVDLPGRSAGGVADGGARSDTPGLGRQGSGAGPLHQRSLVALTWRVPQGRRLAHTQHTAPAKETRTGGV